MSIELPGKSRYGLARFFHAFFVMNICILDQGEIFGGAEGFALDLLRSVSKSQWNMTLLYHKNAHPEYLARAEGIGFIQRAAVSLPSLDHHRFGSYLQTLKSAHAVARELRRRKVDILQTNTNRAHAVGALAAHYAGIPLIWVVHDTTFPLDVLKKLVGYPTKIVCVSEYVRDFVVEHGGVEAAIKTVIIPNGMDLDAVASATPSLRPLTDIDGKSFSFLPHHRYVGLVGRIDTWKGQDVFLEAAHILNTEYPQHGGVEYVLVGDVTATSEERVRFYDQLRETVRSRGLSNVTFLGRQDMGQIFPSLDVLVHASTEPEPFGRTIIEAWAYGVPVVATRLGAPASFVTYGKTGLLVDPKDAKDLAQKISLLLEDHHLAETLKVNGRKEVRARYDLVRVIDMFAELWEETKIFGKIRKKR